MIKKFCKKCFGKKYCVEHKPQMDSNELINILLTSITNQSRKEDVLKILYKFLLPSYRAYLGGFRKFQSFIEINFPGLLSAFQIEITKKFTEIDSCIGYFIISYPFNNKRKFLKIHMERAYNYIDDRPIYDRFIRERLYLFWRISKIENVNSSRGSSNIMYSRF